MPWLIVHTSEIGQSHILSGTPCQDNHQVAQLGEDWGIAVVCDGAGSAENAHIGASFVSKRVISIFEEILFENGWANGKKLPELETWKTVALNGLKKTRNVLDEYARENNLLFPSLASTIIVVIFSPYGLLLTHIGDGRACYRNRDQQWKALMNPHKGEEENQTIFITSNGWSRGDMVLSGITVPECVVITDLPTSFAVMSDGCEKHSFELGYYDEENQYFVKQNIPHENFFEPLFDSLNQMYENDEPQEEIGPKWSKFIQSGLDGLKNESDDKTMILGILQDEPTHYERNTSSLPNVRENTQTNK